MFDVKAALRELVEKGGSDLHLKVDSAPLYRVNGELGLDEGAQPLSAQDTEGALRTLLSDEVKLAEFAQEHEVDFSFEIEDVARYRINAFQQRGVISMACRAIPHRISTIDELALPPVVRELAEEERGIVLLDRHHRLGEVDDARGDDRPHEPTMSKHIVTIEDPIEFVHADKRSAINQREVGMDTASFKRALRRVLRQDPDVILVGEMRDEETVQTALSAAETGHLVLSTIHTVDAHRVDQPHARLLPPAPARPGAQHDRRHRQGRHLAAAGAGRRRWPRGRVRDPAHDRARARHDRRPVADGQARRGDHLAAATTACRPSTRRCSATSRPAA